MGISPSALAVQCAKLSGEGDIDAVDDQSTRIWFSFHFAFCRIAVDVGTNGSIVIVITQSEASTCT